MKVLVVDDLEYSRKLICDRVKLLGHQAFEAKDGEEAIAVCKSILPDYIFMDIVMPKMDGITAIKRIKDEVETKIIVCSSINNKKMVMKAIFAGAYSYIFKPVDISQIDNMLNSLYMESINPTNFMEKQV